MRRMYPAKLFILAALALVLSAFPVAADIIHVPGDYADIQDAIDAAGAGDTILFAAGTYSGDYDINHGGISFLADGNVVLTGATSDFFFCSLDDPGPMTYMTGFTFQGNRVAIFIDMYFSLTLNDCIFRDNDNGIYACSDGPLIIESCLFEDNHADWIGGGIAACLLELGISDCVFRGNTAGALGGAVYLDTPFGPREFRNCLFLENHAPQGSVAYVEFGGLSEFINCTFYANDGGATLTVGMDYTSLRVENCIISENLGADFACVDNGNLEVFCTDSWGNAGGNWADCGAEWSGQNGNFSLDPLFCDAPGGDFTLYDVSPCLPENNDCGVLIGAYGQGCTVTAVEDGSWSLVKSLY